MQRRVRRKFTSIPVFQVRIRSLGVRLDFGPPGTAHPPSIILGKWFEKWHTTLDDRLVVARYNGVDWETRQEDVTEYYARHSYSCISSFSPFTFGSIAINPLPVELVSFNASLKNDEVEIVWSTASERNNDFFTAERAVDLERFETLETVDGKGTSSESHRYNLKDKNPIMSGVLPPGKLTRRNHHYSNVRYDIRPHFPSLRPTFTVVAEYIIEIRGLKNTSAVPISIINVQGQVVFSKVFQWNATAVIREILFFETHLRPGLYVIQVGSSMRMVDKIVVE